jgi:DNA polymerase-3 subunit chi
MTEIAFYQLRNTPLERALPKLLEKAVDGGHRTVVLGGSEERIEALNAALWTYDQGSFLPHGTARDGRPERQPIFLTTEDENPNNATIMIMVDGVAPNELTSFERCLDMFDGTDPAALQAARGRWKAHQAEGRSITYWEQGEGGKWERRA